MTSIIKKPHTEYPEIVLTSSDDLNNAYSHATMYRINQSDLPLNAPFSASMNVLAIKTPFGHVQIAQEFNANRTAFRARYQNSWRDWWLVNATKI